MLKKSFTNGSCIHGVQGDGSRSSFLLFPLPHLAPVLLVFDYTLLQARMPAGPLCTLSVLLIVALEEICAVVSSRSSSSCWDICRFISSGFITRSAP
eukprot:Skav223092  [mRNA]  locus=scaffold419:445057:447176:- [translate_table: standard]